MKRRLHKSASISSSRWAAYAVAGLATAPGLVATAEAEIHYSGRINLQLPEGQTKLPLSGGDSLLFDHEATSGGIYDYMWVTPGVNEGVATDPTSFFLAGVKFHRRANVSTANPFNAFAVLINAYQSGQFVQQGQGIAAFKFDTGKGYQYGWVRIRTTVGGANNQIEIIDYAWADPGKPILTGQTKEGVLPEADSAEEKTAANRTTSGSLGLLALGSAGLAVWRKARAAAR